MANGALVIEGGRIVRINLVDPMVPGTRFVREGIAFVVTGEGETAEPVSLASGARDGRPSPAVGALLAVAGLALLVFLFLKPKRRRRR
jgi:hypothetical protein